MFSSYSIRKKTCDAPQCFHHCRVDLVVSAQPPGTTRRSALHTGTNSGTTAHPEDPDAATFKRAVAKQATEEQIAQFRLMTKSTEAARKQALDLQHLSSNAAGSEDLTSKASGLQDSVEKALTDTRIFLQSFSDSQEANLKNLAKKLTKSGAAVNKSDKGISQQLEQTNAKLWPTHQDCRESRKSSCRAAIRPTQSRQGNGRPISLNHTPALPRRPQRHSSFPPPFSDIVSAVIPLAADKPCDAKQTWRRDPVPGSGVTFPVKSNRAS